MMKRDKSSGVEELYGEERTQNEEMRQAWSVLSVSVLKERSPRIISLLVEKGADVNFTNAAGYTPLHTGLCSLSLVLVVSASILTSLVILHDSGHAGQLRGG
jgi:hypothetical protein